MPDYPAGQNFKMSALFDGTGLGLTGDESVAVLKPELAARQRTRRFTLAQLITELTLGTDIDGGDHIAIIHDPNGIPILRKFPIQSVFTLVNLARRQGTIIPRGSSLFVDAIGEIAGGSAGSQTAIPSTTTDGFMIQQEAVAGANAYYVGRADIWKPGRNFQWSSRLRLSSATDGRFWAGLLDAGTTITGWISSDDPATAQCAAFRASSNVPDTNFMAVCKDGGSTTAVDTGVPIDTAAHTFNIVELTSAGDWFFYIDNLLVATISTSIPLNSGVNYQQGAGIRPITATQSFQWGWFIASTDF